MATVVAVKRDKENIDLTLECPFAGELSIDQSVAHNGVCLTVVALEGNTYTVTAMKETLDRSNLGLLKEGDKIELDELEFTVWETPGHTAGCLTYFCGDAIFTGDTLFVQSCGRTDMYSSDFMDMVDSLTRLRSIKTNYHMYPGHEQDGMLFDQYAWIDSLVARVRAAYGR